MPGRTLFLGVAALALLSSAGCAESTSAEPRPKATAVTAAAPVCPAKVNVAARARFARFATPAFSTLHDLVVAPIGGGRGADVVVRTEAAKAGATALIGLTRAHGAALADQGLCRELGPRLATLITTVRTLNTTLAARPDAKGARAAGAQAAAVKAAATRLGVRLGPSGM